MGFELRRKSVGNGRGGGIRTPGPLLPKQMRYQAALRPDLLIVSRQMAFPTVTPPRQTAPQLQMMEEPVEDPRQHYERDGEDREEDEQQCKQEKPVSPGVAAGMLDVPDEQLVVAAVGLPSDVKSVAQEGDGADDHIQREVHGHARKRDIGNAPHPRGEDQDARSETSKHISDGWYQADDAVEPESYLGAGNAKAVVENVGEDVEVFIAEQAGARTEARWLPCIAGGEDLGLYGLWHPERILAGRPTCLAYSKELFPDAPLPTGRLSTSSERRVRKAAEWYNQESHGGYSSVAERRSVDPDVVGSTPTSRPKSRSSLSIFAAIIGKWLTDNLI